MTRWECSDCDADPETLRQRGRCGGPIAADHPDARLDADGRVFVGVEDTCGGGVSMPGDLRCYSCPVAAAATVARSGLPAVYASTQGGIPLERLGIGVLSDGARLAVDAMGRAWAWREGIVRERARRKR